VTATKRNRISPCAGVFGAYLLGVYDPDSESYQTISKLGTGFSEEQLVQLAESLSQHIIPGPKPFYRLGQVMAGVLPVGRLSAQWSPPPAPGTAVLAICRAGGCWLQSCAVRESWRLRACPRATAVAAPCGPLSYSESLVPDVWFDTVAVWEVKAADLSISPKHKAASGLVDASKGISIRCVPRREPQPPKGVTRAGLRCLSPARVAAAG
jgi:ATP-dependent DNA ligase